jgi:hypothetical protein
VGRIGKGGGGGEGGEMTQTLYAHMNKRKKILKINQKTVLTGFVSHNCLSTLNAGPC